MYLARHTLSCGSRTKAAKLKHDDGLAWSQGLSNSASGTRVVLPPPGGAWSTTFSRSLRSFRRAGNAELIGKELVGSPEERLG